MKDNEFQAIKMKSDGPMTLMFTTKEPTEEMKKEPRRDYVHVDQVKVVDQGYLVTRKSGVEEFYSFDSVVKAVRNIEAVLEESDSDE